MQVTSMPRGSFREEKPQIADRGFSLGIWSFRRQNPLIVGITLHGSVGFCLFLSKQYELLFPSGFWPK